MTSINLNIDGSELFGDNLPTVFIQSIELNPYEDVEYDNGLKIDVKLDIKFTTPKILTEGDVISFITEELSDLYLYAHINPVGDFNQQLEQGTFSMYEFLDAYDDYESVIPEGYKLGYAIKLQDLVSETLDETITYKSNVKTSQSFDEKGNQIMAISNIELSFKHKGYESLDESDLVGPMSNIVTDLRDIGSYYLISSVGYKTETMASKLPIPLRDNSFGSVTYCHMLTGTEVSNRFYKQYVKENGSPVNSEVFQSINGKFYSGRNYGHQQIKDAFSAIIDPYQAQRQTDIVLNKNISDLEAIINAENNKVAMLGEIVTFQSTYPNKDITTQSGQFYNNFVAAFSEVLASVSAQEQVYPRLFIDGLITDLRSSLITGTYIKPTLPDKYVPVSAADVVKVRGMSPDFDTGGFDTIIQNADGDFIPANLFVMTRTAIPAEDLYSSTSILNGIFAFDEVSAEGTTYASGDRLIEDLSGAEATFALEQLLDNTSGTYPAGGGRITAPLTAYGLGEYSTLWNRLYFNYQDEGFPPEEASELATNELNYMISNGVTGISRMLFGSGDLGEEKVLTEVKASSVGTTHSENIVTLGDAAKSLNYVVMNHGMFFFNYEAAVRTQSKIAQLINIDKAQRYFRLNVSYDMYYLREVAMERRELYVGLSSLGSSPKSNEIRCRIFADFKNEEGDYKSYESADATEDDFLDTLIATDSKPYMPVQNSTGIAWSGDTGSAILEFDVYKMKYLRPVLKVATTGEEFFPSLKLVNFDIPTANANALLKNHNTLSPFSNGYPSGNKVLDGYRLMAFEFTDIMDDDVAYYNSSTEYLSEDTDRASDLGELNAEGIRRTVYKIRISCIDKTEEYLGKLYAMAYNVYTHYVDYADVAREICSYNNITNSYNDFFVEAINQKYPAEDDKPWVKAAYYAVALSDLFFNPDEIGQDEFDEMVLRELIKIAPGTGTLESTIDFKDTLADLVNRIKVGAPATPDGPGTRMKTLTDSGDADLGIHAHSRQNFGQLIDFASLSPITGDFFPSIAEHAETFFDPRPSSPLIAIPSDIYVGGAIESITGDTTAMGGLGGGSTEGRTDITYASVTNFQTIYAGFVGETPIYTFGDTEFIAPGGEGEEGSFDYFDVRAALAYGEFVNTYDAAYTDLISDTGMVDDFIPELSLRNTDTGVNVNLKRYRGDSLAYVNLINPDSSGVVKMFYDEVLMPYNHQDWRCWLYGVFKMHAGGGTGIYYQDSHPRGSLESAIYRTSIERLGVYPIVADDSGSTTQYHPDFRFRIGGKTSYGNKVITAAAKLADEMFRRTTVDVKFKKLSGVEGGRYQGRARVSGTRWIERRTKRNLTQLAYILEHYLIPEAARRIAEEDIARYSTIVQAKQNANDFRFSSSGMSSGHDPIQIHIIIKSLLEAMRDAAQDQLLAGMTDAQVIAGSGAVVLRPSLGMSKVMNNESVNKYKGPAADRDLAAVFADPETSLV